MAAVKRLTHISSAVIVVLAVTGLCLNVFGRSRVVPFIQEVHKLCLLGCPAEYVSDDMLPPLLAENAEIQNLAVDMYDDKSFLVVISHPVVQFEFTNKSIREFWGQHSVIEAPALFALFSTARKLYENHMQGEWKRGWIDYLKNNAKPVFTLMHYVPFREDNPRLEMSLLQLDTGGSDSRLAIHLAEHLGRYANIEYGSSRSDSTDEYHGQFVPWPLVAFISLWVIGVVGGCIAIDMRRSRHIAGLAVYILCISAIVVMLVVGIACPHN